MKAKKAVFKDVKALFLVAAAVLVYQSCSSAADENQPETDSEKLTYLGDAACKSCHETEFAAWQESHHSKSMQLPTAQTVLADFNNATFAADGVSYIFFTTENAFKIAITDAGSTDTFSVKYTFGFTPLQQFLVETENGKVQTLRASWDTEKKRWFHQFPKTNIDKNDWFHFTNQSANWNGMCAHCHSTNVVKGFAAEDETYHSTFDVINVSCESCHGAGSKHVSLAQKADYDGAKSGFPNFGEGNLAEVNMCGGCHSRRGQLHDAVQPGEEYHDAFNISWLNDRNYVEDGQIKEEDFELGSFMSSKMFHKNVTCTNCHNAHSMKLKFEGNALCLQCHTPNYNSKAHHFHEENKAGANCVDCHMTGKYYMGNDFRHDHSFRIPRPDQSVTYGTPNACNGCHDDKKAEWAATTVQKWYGKNRKTHFSDLLLQGWVDGKADRLVSLANDTAMPVISRGTAIFYVSQLDVNAIIANIKRWTADPEILIRKAAQQAIRDFPAEQRLVYAAPALNDKSRSVRLEAVTNLLDVNQNNIPPAYKSAFFNALAEHKTYLKYAADFPEGQGQIGQFYYQQGNYDEAIRAYKKGLQIDSLRTELRLNLAILYNIKGENEKGLQQFNRIIAQEPTDRVYYLRGLLLGEMNRLDEGILDMQAAIKSNPNDPAYYYNLVLMMNQAGKRQQAIGVLKDGLSRHPQNERLRSLLPVLR